MSRRYAIAWVVLLLAGTAGCAQGQEYAVPGDVCGVEVQSALLRALLPPGDSFKQRKTQEGGEDVTGCAMDVDERRKDLTRFIAAYLPAAQTAAGCTWSKWGTNHYSYDPRNPVGLALVIITLLFVGTTMTLIANRVGPFKPVTLE